MWQAQVDSNNIVINVNDWEHAVGIPCTEFTPIGWQWNGSEFVEPVSSVIERYDQALLQHFDLIAQSRRYDNRVTCALRAGYSGPFQQDGIDFGVWMDTCNATAYQIMDDVLSGSRPLPTIEEFLAELPTITWTS